MNKYKVRLWIADDSLRNDINLMEYENFIIQAKEYYNDVSSRSKNIKNIESIEILSSEILVQLSSRITLSTPTIALQVFSGYLVKHTPMSSLVRHKALFRGVGEPINKEISAYISDEGALKKIIELVYSTKKNDKERLERIKNILLESERR